MSFIGLNFTFGSAIYLYASLLMGKKLAQNWYWHGVPVAILFLAGFYYFFIPPETLNIYLKELLVGNHIPMVLLNVFLLIHILIYLIISKMTIFRCRTDKSFDDNAVAKIKSKWANDFVNYMIFNTLILMLSYTVAITLFAKTYFFCDMVILPIISLSIYSFIVYKNFQNAVTFENITQLNDPIDKLKEKKSALNENEKNSL